MKELKPCPFCGEKDDLGDYRDQYPNSEVLCGNCGAHAHGDTWNTRNNDAVLDEVREAVNDLDMLEKKYDECTSALGNQYIRGCIEKTRDAIKAIDNLRGRDE